MKKYEKKYQEYFHAVNLTKEEKKEIKENIIKKDKKKVIFRFASIPTILICVLFIGGVIAVTANSITRQFKVQEGNRVVMENEKLDIDIEADSLDKEKIYTREELENLLGIKILKNSKIGNYFKIGRNSLKANNGKLARVYFENVNQNGKRIIERMNIGFGLKTKYYETKEEEASWISGPTTVEYYYMKTLDTEAVTLEGEGDTAPIFAEFVYDNIVYGLDTSKFDYDTEYIYSILNSYTQ